MTPRSTAGRSRPRIRQEISPAAADAERYATAAALALTTALFVADALLSRPITGVMAVCPVVAAVASRAGRVMAVSLFTVAVAVVAGFPGHDFGNTEHVLSVLGVAVSGVLATTAAAQRSRREQEVRALDHRTDLILRSAGDGVYGLDRRGRTTFANPAAVATLGWTLEELRRGDEHELIHHHRADGSDYPVEECPIHASIREGTARRETDDVFWHKDGSAVPVDYTSMPLQEGGRIVGAVVTFSDATDRLKREAYRMEATRLSQRQAAQQQVVDELLRVFNPALPTVPGAGLGLHFQPASNTAPTGGDLYDLVVLPDGSVHIAIVDVMGHGVSATRHALAVMHAIRVLVLEGWPVEDVLRRADAVVGTQLAEMMATALVARYDPGTGRLEVAGGGHPPALVIGPDGRAEYLEAPGAAIGVPGAGSDGKVVVTLDPDATVLFYTDGLVESTKDVERGLDALRDRARRLAGEDVGRLATRLVAMARDGASHPDDTLALALRRLPGGAPAADRSARDRSARDRSAAETSAASVAQVAGPA